MNVLILPVRPIHKDQYFTGNTASILVSRLLKRHANPLHALKIEYPGTGSCTPRVHCYITEIGTKLRHEIELRITGRDFRDGYTDDEFIEVVEAIERAIFKLTKIRDEDVSTVLEATGDELVEHYSPDKLAVRIFDFLVNRQIELNNKHASLDKR